MEVHEAIRRRAMVRSFSEDPVRHDVVDRLLSDALRSPTAGNTSGVAWVALMGPDETATYWNATTDAAWRARNRRRSEGLMRAPVVLLAYSSPAAYVARYAEPDKSDPELGGSPERWPVPYWHGDAAFAVMAVLLEAVEVGMGACVLGAFRGRAELSLALGVPDAWELFCAVVLGYPDGNDRSTRSLRRSRPGAGDRIHWGAWS